MSTASVVGLGEATHGQHEAFDLKRRLTMHLIRNHGFRVVAYEASASRVVACNDYVTGRSNDRSKAIAGLGMLIWQVEENGQLLDDARSWNKAAKPEDRVRFIGCDAQSGPIIIHRLNELIAEAKTLSDTIRQQARKASLDLPVIDLRLREFLAHLGLYCEAGARDKAMADLLLAQLGPESTRSKCIVWAHNAHVQRSPLTYRRSPALAMGGHLAKALDKRYYALGFFFGRGEFQANLRDKKGTWRFHRYNHSAPSKGSLGEFLGKSLRSDFLLDLRSAPQANLVQAWLRSPHGHRWWGGYNIPEDFEKRTSEASSLFQCAPIESYDGLVFHHRTTAAQHVNAALIQPR